MKNSGFGKTGDIIPNHALPYKKRGDRILIAENNIIGEPPSGAGGEFTTAPDMFKVFQSIITDEKLLNNNSKALLFNHFQTGDWDIIIKSDQLTGYVGGDTRGWSAKLTFMFNKGTPYGVVILSNFDNMAHELDLKLRGIILKLK
jgi:CubicO group peptidase (beta-lactamase class C family)